MPLSPTDMLLRLAVAVVLGGAIGVEREMRGQPAGLRTYLLVALAAAAFMLVSAHFAFFQHYPREALDRVDGSRIASNVVVGIGFLGAGLIVRAGQHVKGLTTAASLWLAAAVGLASGAGMWILAVSSAAIALLALAGLRYLERRAGDGVAFRVRLDLEGDILGRQALEDHLRPVGVTVRDAELRRDVRADRTRMTLDVRIAGPGLEEAMLRRLELLPQVRQIRIRRADQP